MKEITRKILRWSLALLILVPSISLADPAVNISTGIKFIYLEGERSSIPGTNAAQHSFIYNNEGIEPAEGGNGYLGFDINDSAGPLLLYLNPLFSTNEDTTKGILQKGFIKLRIKAIDLEIGKDSLWWGQGYHGGLFLTNNAEPLKMIRLTNPSPALLPWIFRYLGPFRFDVFVSRLEEDRDVPEPYFTGIRFNFKPHSVLELGLTRTIIMGGEGRPGITPKRFWEIMFGENKVGNEELSNSIAGMDLRFTLPFLHLYGELGGEDEAGGLPYQTAYLVGLYFPNLGRNMDLRIEYADITNEVWYRHGLYSSGYTYKGRILGHHVGGGGRDLFIEMGIMKGNILNGSINFDYEERGVTTQPVTERHYQMGTEWNYKLGKAMVDWSIKIGLAYERIKNADYTAGLDKDNSLISVGIKGEM